MANRLLHILKLLLIASLLALSYLSADPPLGATGSQDGHPLRETGTGEPAGEEVIQRTRATPGELLAAFTLPRAKREGPAPDAAEVAEAPKSPTPAPWLRTIGSVIDEQGIQWRFYKDTRMNRPLKVRVDGKAEDGAALVRVEADADILSVNGELYSVERSGQR